MRAPRDLDVVLVAHNHYQEGGGEDVVFEAEAALLESRGHRVVRYEAHNDDIGSMAAPRLAGRTFWSTRSYRELRELIGRERPSIAHFHNTFPLISPSAYYAAAAEGVPVIQTLHNYRLLCVNALLFRDGAACEDCLEGRSLWPGVRHACYRKSRAVSGVAAAMLTTHWKLRTWARKVHTYVALSEFARGKFVQAGLPAERIRIKPNFLGVNAACGAGDGGYALFAGRLSAEKGVEVLFEAWKRLDGRLPLKIVGDGPLAELVAERSAGMSSVEWLGARPRTEVISLLQGAALVVHPSLAYENMPIYLIEAFATGSPAIVSGHGALAEMVEDGAVGRHFAPGDAGDLAAKVAALMDDPGERERMSRQARKLFERSYTEERNYDLLMEIYRGALAPPETEE
jgi:glycosyltransferase involved in cell wall biosynthesis